MLGYLVVSIILMLGDRGQTHVVLAGLMVFTLPILDTFMAIVRRRLSGKRMSDPDSDHIHHQLKRALGRREARRAYPVRHCGFFCHLWGLFLLGLTSRQSFEVVWSTPVRWLFSVQS